MAQATIRRPMDPLVRWFIQRRLEDGRLPRGRIADVQPGLGDGRECDGCGAIIAKDQKAVSAIAVEDWRKLQMHVECFGVWERLKSSD